MWQRIQTLYLAISTVLIAVMLFTCKAVVPGADGEIAEAFRYTAYLPYLILLIIITILNVLALTTYKIRIFQMRTAIFAALITIALQGWLAVDYFTADKILVFRVSVIFPLIAVICDFLAAKNIYADELMVSSFSRLRSGKKKK